MLTCKYKVSAVNHYWRLKTLGIVLWSGVADCTAQLFRLFGTLHCPDVQTLAIDHLMAEIVSTVGAEPKKIGIMVCGKTGIGKSTLLNILLGTKNRFPVNGPGGFGDNCMEAGTEDVRRVSEIMHGVEVTMYDTPGLQSDHNDNRIIAEMAQVKEKVDLVLFCIDSTSTRWVAEAQTVKNLHSFFGEEFWMNCIFVITRSNMTQQAIFEDDDLTLEEKVASCEKAAEDIFKCFKQELLKLRASPDVVKDIPLVAAGSHKKRKLPFVAPKVYNEDFLPELWSLAVKRCRVQTRLLFTMVSNYKEKRFISQNSITTLSPEDQAAIAEITKAMQMHEPLNDTSTPTSQETGSQPIKLSKKQSRRIHKALALAVGVSLGVKIVVGVGTASLITLALGGPVGVGVAAAAVGLIGLGAVTAGVYIYLLNKKLKTTDQP